MLTQEKKHETQTTHEEIFEIKTANECLSEAADEPPMMLFGDLWVTGELSVMFAEAGGGKSLVAVQIAESIARGKAIEPFELTAPAQKVLYIDLEQSASQFRRRYTAEAATEAGRKPPRELKRHRFSNNFLRFSFKDTADLNASKLAPVIEASGAKVVIIDNIAYLQRYSIPRETAAVMRELRRLKNRFGLSILVLTHTARSVPRRGLAAADMACSGVMTNFADNIFAVGRCRNDASARYIKHIKPGASALAYGAAHLPWFRIVNRKETFPVFEFQGYQTETALLAGDGDNYEWRTIREIKTRSVGGAKIREIAADLNMSKSTVQRYLKMAPDEWGLDTDDSGTSAKAVVDKIKAPSDAADYFPGCEEFAAAENDPKFANVYDGEPSANLALRREYWLLGEARRRAHKIYKQCGKAPTLAEMLSEPPASAGGQTLGNERSPTNEIHATSNGLPETTLPTDPSDPANKLPALTRSINAYGREILVEKMGADKRPEIWYSRDSKGNWMRHERKSGTGIIITPVDGPVQSNGAMLE